MGKQTYVIVGGGVAGASAAEALRGEGYDGRIVIIGEEQEAPYQRPPLSKELLRAELEPAAIALRAPDYYKKNDIELHCETRAVELNLVGRTVRCADGRELAYDKLLIATGAKPRELGVAGEQLANVHYLRTLNDALRLRAKFAAHPRVLVVGTGFIGCEVAASARQLGCEVTLLGPSLPMEHVLGKEVAALYSDRHVANGVVLRTGVTAVAFRGNEAIVAARISDGSELRCEIVVIGAGVIPAVGWLNPQIVISDGVHTDELCRTNIDGIFAAGDVACSWRPRLQRRLRLEHFDNAESQGAAAGRAMHGSTRAYDPVPFFWSEQYDLSLQYYGFSRDWERIAIRRDSGGDSLAAFYLKGDRIDAACIVNRSQDANAAKRLIGRTGVLDRDLSDQRKPLKALIPVPQHV